MEFKIKKIIPITILSLAFGSIAKVALADICDFIDGLYKYSIGLIGILAGLGIAIAGVIWVTAAGNDSKIKEAKSWIGSSLLGLTLALLSFLILGTINPELTTCTSFGVGAIPTIGSNYNTNTKSTAKGLVYSPKSQQKGLTVNNHTGKKWCCVIDGDLDGSNILWDREIKRCASYDMANRQAAEKECLRFYSNYNESTPMLTGKNWTSPNRTKVPYYEIKTLYLETGHIGGGDKNSATVYTGVCQKNPNASKWCKPKADKTFCKGKSSGTECKLTDGITWGYCKNDICNPCKKWGEACDRNYECPVQIHKLSTHCGNSLTGQGLFGSDCATSSFFGFGTGKCAYIGPPNYY